MADRMCPSCHTVLTLKEKDYPMGSAFLKADRFHVDIYECPECHGVRLYAAEPELVTCPKCGSLHSPREACAVCALNGAIDEATH
ncbi:MAG: zf-TFIIB domain-containing protein [Synergistaceae bacterium]|nr:zf-TFIIB domain-containing protein [Synergistaceae bacterium]